MSMSDDDLLYIFGALIEGTQEEVDALELSYNFVKGTLSDLHVSYRIVVRLIEERDCLLNQLEFETDLDNKFKYEVGLELIESELEERKRNV